MARPRKPKVRTQKCLYNYCDSAQTTAHTKALNPDSAVHLCSSKHLSTCITLGMCVNLINFNDTLKAQQK